jgi:hypothetical protein
VRGKFSVALLGLVAGGMVVVAHRGLAFYWARLSGEVVMVSWTLRFAAGETRRLRLFRRATIRGLLGRVDHRA